MTDKRFKHSEIVQDDGQTICYGIEDTQTRHIFNVIGGGVYDVSEKELIKLLNELHEEVMDLRRENTKFKLIVSEIIEDMQKYVDDNQLVYINQSYVDWIKKEVDTTLYSQKKELEE
jgi:hypothetical protein